MMTKREQENERWLYGFRLEDRVPQDHLLRKIKQAIDFNFIYDLVEHHYSTTGAPSVDPVVVFKLSLIGYLYNIESERQLLEDAALNMAYLWFLGYDIDEALPDHSIMTKARVRFGPDVFREFFHQVVRTCVDAGLVEGDTVFLDSTLIDSKSRPDIVRSKRLVGQLQSKADRFIDQIFKDDQEISGASGGLPSRSNNRLASPTDPDADIVRRGPGIARLCYKGHFAVDGSQARIITAAALTGGVADDGHHLLPLITEHQGLVKKPDYVVADRKYGTTTNFRILKARGIRPAIRPLPGRPPAPGYSKDRFSYDERGDVYRCPASKTLTTAKRLGSWKTYRSKKADCSACGQKQWCIPKSARRAIMRGPNDVIFAWAWQMAGLAQAKELLIQRNIWSETIFAEAKCYHGLHKARFRARWKVEIQLLMTAAAMNLKKLAQYRPKPEKVKSAHVAGSLNRLLWRLKFAE